MWRARALPMTPAAPDTPSPAAVTAFLRGLDRRARLFASVQAGDAVAAQHALAVVARVFTSDAGQWPIAEWPGQYWRLLLAAPSLRQPPIEVATPRLPGIGRLPAETRAAVLLHLVAGLDDAAASAALGIGIDAYQACIRDALPRDALGQPDVDVWRAWRAAVERELARAPEPASPPDAPDAQVAPAQPVRPASVDADARHHFRLRWLWAGVALCIVAMVATYFLHPRGREVLDQWRASIKREALDAAAPPKARFDAADMTLHPDRDLLEAPGELAFARQLPLLAWLDIASADLPRSRRGAPAGDAGASTRPTRQRPRTTRLRWRSAGSAGMRCGRRRVVRNVARGQAWRALSASERVRLRAIAARWQLLAGEERVALRARFDALPADARHGYWLGPRMGRHWPRVAPLFAFAPERQRVALLVLLRAADTEDIDALERLAQITPPEERDALRSDLLRVPAVERRAWMLAKVRAKRADLHPHQAGDRRTADREAEQGHVAGTEHEDTSAASSASPGRRRASASAAGRAASTRISSSYRTNQAMSSNEAAAAASRSRSAIVSEHQQQRQAQEGVAVQRDDQVLHVQPALEHVEPASASARTAAAARTASTARRRANASLNSARIALACARRCASARADLLVEPAVGEPAAATAGATGLRLRIPRLAVELPKLTRGLRIGWRRRDRAVFAASRSCFRSLAPRLSRAVGDLRRRCRQPAAGLAGLSGACFAFASASFGSRRRRAELLDLRPRWSRRRFARDRSFTPTLIGEVPSMSIVRRATKNATMLQEHEQAHRGDVAHAPAGEVFQRQVARLARTAARWCGRRARRC